MQVILRQDVPSLGVSGATVRVKDGYGRNYLIPRGLAVLADRKNANQVAHARRVIEQQQKKQLTSAQAIKSRLESLAVNIAKSVGEEGKLFGSVTTREIADALAAQGVVVDRKTIHLAEPIKSLGVHQATVRVAPQVAAELKVWVVEQ